MSETSEAPYIDTGAMSNAEAIAFMHAQAEIHALCPGAMPHGPSATCPVCNLSRITLDTGRQRAVDAARDRGVSARDGGRPNAHQPLQRGLMTITPEDLEAIRAEMAGLRERVDVLESKMEDVLPDLTPAKSTDPARITYTDEMEAELAAMWSEPLREWAERFARDARMNMGEPGPALHNTFYALWRDGLIDGGAEGAIAFQWWMTKKSTAPGWNEPAPSPAATFRKYAREVGGQAGI